MSGLGRLVLGTLLAGVLVAGLLLPYSVGIGLASNEVTDGDRGCARRTRWTARSRCGRRSPTPAAPPIATFYDQNRVYVPLSSISDYLQVAVISMEDRRFYQHQGVDWRGTVRALLRNAQSTTQLAAGRFHPDPAVREELPVPGRGQDRGREGRRDRHHPDPQAARSQDGAEPRADAQQGRDPRALPEPGGLRAVRSTARRPRRQWFFGIVRGQADPRPGRAAGRHGEQPAEVQPARREPRAGRPRPPRPGARRHGQRRPAVQGDRRGDARSRTWGSTRTGPATAASRRTTPQTNGFFCQYALDYLASAGFDAKTGRQQRLDDQDHAGSGGDGRGEGGRHVERGSRRCRASSGSPTPSRWSARTSRARCWRWPPTDPTGSTSPRVRPCSG